MPEGSDMHRQSHLVQQPSTRTYFFRSIIPKALRNHFDGQREFKVSLGCKSKARSQRASFYLYGVVHHLYDSIQAGQSQMTLEEIKHILRIELEKSFRYIKHIQLRTNRYNAERVQAAIADLEAKKSNYNSQAFTLLGSIYMLVAFIPLSWRQTSDKMRGGKIELKTVFVPVGRIVTA